MVIGAGQAGLIASRLLQDAGREHVVLEARQTLGGGWQDRWDGFRLVTPNFLADLPGMPYDGPDPDAFMTRDDMVDRVRRYADVVGAPVSRGTRVQRLSAASGGTGRFALETSRGPVAADTVIAATGAFHVPRIPDAATALDPSILQLHAASYRNPEQLPPGGVLVVGSGQTGVQLAEELHASGRRVTLSVGRCGRLPRRYRGYDIFWWVREVARNGAAYGARLPTVGELPDPRARFACNPHLSGHDGGHETNLRQLALDGIRLAGRFAGAGGSLVRFDADLAPNLDFADEFFETRFQPIIDAYASRAGIEVAADDRATVAYDPPEATELDLRAEDIGTVVWTTGYRPDYGWLDLPILDEFGTPRHERGVSEVPGLFFLGMLLQHDNASANLAGVGRDAAYLAERW